MVHLAEQKDTGAKTPTSSSRTASLTPPMGRTAGRATRSSGSRAATALVSGKSLQPVCSSQSRACYDYKRFECSHVFGDHRAPLAQVLDPPARGPGWHRSKARSGWLNISGKSGEGHQVLELHCVVAQVFCACLPRALGFCSLPLNMLWKTSC